MFLYIVALSVVSIAIGSCSLGRRGMEDMGTPIVGYVKSQRGGRAPSADLKNVVLPSD